MKKFLVFILVAVMMLGCVVAVSAKEDYTIKVLEDAYVINANSEGNQKDNNFGADKEIHLKTNGSSLTRYGYLKFDISSLAGDTEYTCIDLELTLTSRQKDAGDPELGTIEVYGAPTDWEEATITFNDRPEELGLITVNNSISIAKVANAFSITDYVRQALAKGEKTIALYLVENTPVKKLHTRFASKENGDESKIPVLRVYHGTKTDTQTYGGVPVELPYEYIPSKNGIDSFIGEISKVHTLVATEDTYVEGGNNAYTNYGTSEMIDFKAKGDSTGNLHRIPLFKFDISDVDKNNITGATFSIRCNVMQDHSKPVIVDVFSCDPYSWEERVVTYSTKPDYEEFITTVEVKEMKVITIDVTDYVKKAAANGEKLISFYLDGDSTEPLRLNFFSTERETGHHPTLQVIEGGLNFATYLEYEGVNPWEVAVEYVSTWLHRWEAIKARGDMETDMVEKDASEYSVIVDACRAGDTKGYDTKYKQYPTRTLETLKGYDAATATGETAKYDVYGGLMDESMKQEATGFFYTKKIGDRWWTFDPLGYPFYRVACVQISSGAGPNAPKAVSAVHGSNAAWADFATDRLQTLGFNSTGGWSSINLLSQVEQPLAQTQILYVLNDYVKQAELDLVSSGSSEMVGNVLPVFDPAFVASADNTVKSKISAYGYDTKDYVYGWMSDNELPDELDMLDSALSFDTADSRLHYSYATAWTFMYLKTGKKDVSLDDVTDELRKEYRAMVYDRYFEVTTNALERYAPYHQYMGCRFLSGCYKDEYVNRVAGYWCDVISLNYYGAWEGDPTLMANIEKWSGKPFIVTEWYAKGMDVWEKDNRMTNQSGAGFTVRTQNDRGLFYDNYALMLMECKGCVGFDWFQYWDNDPENLNADASNRNANKGIYSTKYEEYTVLTDYMEKLNNQKYTIINFFDAR